MFSAAGLDARAAGLAALLAQDVRDPRVRRLSTGDHRLLDRNSKEPLIRTICGRPAPEPEAPFPEASLPLPPEALLPLLEAVAVSDASPGFKVPSLEAVVLPLTSLSIVPAPLSPAAMALPLVSLPIAPPVSLLDARALPLESPPNAPPPLSPPAPLLDAVAVSLLSPPRALPLWPPVLDAMESAPKPPPLPASPLPR